MLYPILTESRLLSDLSGVWDFKLDNGNGFDEKWYEAPLKDADTMPVPASYNDLKEGADFRLDIKHFKFYILLFAAVSYKLLRAPFYIILKYRPFILDCPQ